MRTIVKVFPERWTIKYMIKNRNDFIKNILKIKYCHIRDFNNFKSNMIIHYRMIIQNSISNRYRCG